MSDQQCDRGAHPFLEFRRCARGFILSVGHDYDRPFPRTIWAFDRIEDAADWLVQQYRDFPEREERDTEVNGAA